MYILLFIVLLGLSQAFNTTDPLTIQLFHSLNHLGAPVISPDLTKALYTVSAYHQDSNTHSSYINLLDLTSGNITQLTENRPGTTLSNPFWFNTTTFGFLKRNAVYQQNIQYEAFPTLIFDPPIPISNVQYRASRQVLSFVASVYPNSTLEESRALKRAEAMRTDSAMVYDDLWARHWNQWMTLEKPNLFIIPLYNQTLQYNLCRQLPHVSDPLHGWSIDDYVVSPQGDRAILATRPPQGVAWSTKSNLYLVATQPNRELPRLLNARTEGQASQPVFSQDGQRVAWLQMETGGYEADINRIYVYTIGSRETVAVAYNWELSPHSLAWSEDSLALYAVATDKGRNLIYSIPVTTGKPTRLTTAGSASGVRACYNNTLLYVHSQTHLPPDLHQLEIDTGRSHQLTHLNQELLRDVFLSPATDFWFRGAQTDLVHGWFLKPPGFDSAKKYPLALLIHGGPQQASTQSFGHSQWNPQMYAAAGFVTVQVNFHGSPGYGQNFTNSIRHRWGDLPYVDLMRSLSYLASRYPFIDKQRMVALGGSFGGYMVNWINGHTDGMFRCMVCHDGKFSTLSGYYGTDELWFPEWDLGKPWDTQGRRILENNNPERFAASFKTPTLFVQGEHDFRIPVTESLAAWGMMRRRGVPARLVYFPDEDHWINKAGNSVRWFTEVLGWITRWTNTTSYPVR